MSRLFRHLLLAAALTLPLASLAGQKVEMRTSLGRIVLELDADKAPATVKNFLQYAQDGFYDGTIFHRVIDGFMIQGGGYTKTMGERYAGPPIQNEANNGLKNLRGTIAMARTADPHSATAQFFINVADNGFLDFKAPNGNDWGYCVFGKVIEGDEVVARIAKVPTARRRLHQNVPQEPVLIESVKLLSDK